MLLRSIQQMAPHHAGVPLIVIIVLSIHNILVEHFSMLTTYCPNVQREEVKVGLEKVNLE